MISTRLGAALAAGSLAVGILAGSAGTIVLREGSAVPRTVELTAGSSGMMNGSSGSGPAASTMPGSMQDHHVANSPVPTR